MDRGAGIPSLPKASLLLLLRMHRVLPQTGAVFLQLEFLSTGLAAEDVIQVTRLFADEKHDFRFLLAFGHDDPSDDKLTREPYLTRFARCSKGASGPALASFRTKTVLPEC